MPQTATDTLYISEIRTDGGTQMRAEISAEKVADYAAHIEDGVVFPPVTVYYDGRHYWLAHGFHRIAAHDAVKSATVRANVHAGTREDAVRYALRANAENGKERSLGDLQRCYEAAVANGFCEAHDTKAVKALIRCSTRHAENMTREARAKRKQQQRDTAQRMADEGKTQREIAAELGVAQPTIASWLDQKTQAALSDQDDTQQPLTPTPLTDDTQPAPQPKADTTPTSEQPPRPEPDPDEIADLDRQINEKLQQLADLKADSARRKAHNEMRYQQDATLQAQSLYRTIASWLGMILEVIERHESRGHAITPDDRDREETLRLLDQFTTFLERALP